ncbi:MAG: chorismate-binding protein [Bacteroidales bacterium]|nr:chorismate-binding protein [Bacteroidales bacterium]
MKAKTVEKNNTAQLQQICLERNIPFVSFRYPLDETVTTMVQTQNLPKELHSLSELNTLKGFVITPFFNKKKNASYLLEPDIVVNEEQITSDIYRLLENTKHYQTIEYLNGQGIYIAGKKEFTSQVLSIQKEIKNGNIQKAVLSRIHIEPKSTHFDPALLFAELSKRYPNAFVYLFQIPRAGCWLGATPEPLLLIRENRVETISLAGTQKLGTLPPEKVKWSIKEIEEQDIVTRYIEKILSGFKIDDSKRKGPFTQVAGNLLHLKTSFSFDKKALENRIGEFIEKLHPTPSVCGLPKETAYELLSGIEPHRREYYTGLIGPVNMHGDTSLYVNLRCMKVLEDKLALYLGAGITAASIPDSEWEETNQKKMTLLSVIEKLNYNR